ncbi:MAG: hypothetical protein AAGF11_42375 [Myxococcota bacterium]
MESSTGSVQVASAASDDLLTTEASDGDDSSDGPGPTGCGDGTWDVGEECDDGNQTNADGCNADCQLSGTLLWHDSVGSGFNLIEQAMTNVVAADGTVYVAGYSTDMAMARDGWVGRYSAEGQSRWIRAHMGAGGGNDEVQGLVLDGQGSLYAAGYESTPSAGVDAWIRRYDLDGAEQWTRTYDGPSSGHDVFHSVSLDAEGNIVAVGHHNVVGEAADALLRKYSPDGDVLWTRTHSGSEGGNEMIEGVASSPAGNLYVAGHEKGSFGEGINAWLAKYDNDGNILWTRTYNGGASLNDFYTAVAVVGDDDVVVCGYEVAEDYPWHVLVRRYDDRGALVWADEYLGAAEQGALCYGIAVDSVDDVVITGGEREGEVRRAMLRKYDPTGDVWWSQSIAVGEVGTNHGRSVAIGPNDTIAVAGGLNLGTDARDIWVGVFTP